MKFVTYQTKREPLVVQGEQDKVGRIGWVKSGYVVDIGLAQSWAIYQKKISGYIQLPTEMIAFLEMGRQGMELLRSIADALEDEDLSNLDVEGEPVAIKLEEVKLLPPVPVPRSFRDFYAFEQHVKTARSKRGLGMVPEWYEIPVFYFSNHHAIIGPDDPVVIPSETKELDYELEICCIIGKRGKNISVADAAFYIAGFSILNDWSARDLQRKEMKVGLGPAKGKDFATSIGPYLVTPDELESSRRGDGFDLQMVARVNGREISRGNTRDLYWSFSQMIAQASKDVYLMPGDVIGSGTVGTGCILELGTAVHPWLKPGDIVELEIEKLGVLRNSIVSS